MRQADDGGGVEGRVDSAETQDLGLGAAGGGAAPAGTELAQGGIAILPELAGRCVAAKEEFGSRGAQSRARRISRATADSSVGLRLPPSGRPLVRCTQAQGQR